MIDNVEKQRSNTDFENIPGPRPWETETIEAKEKYLKRAYRKVEENIILREERNENEEKRIKIEIENIKLKLKEKSEKSDK